MTTRAGLCRLDNPAMRITIGIKAQIRETFGKYVDHNLDRPLFRRGAAAFRSHAPAVAC
jgi:hypothetical protein